MEKRYHLAEKVEWIFYFFPVSISNVILLCFSHSFFAEKCLVRRSPFPRACVEQIRCFFLPCRPKRSVGGKGNKKIRAIVLFFFFLIHVP